METQTKNLLKYLILPLALLLVVVYTALSQTRPDFKLHVYFYDKAALIRTSAGNKILVDGGPDDKILSLVGADLPFYDHTIDLLILTKVDSSHVSGLVQVLKRYKVKAVLIPPSDANLAVYWTFLDLVEANKVKKIFARAGQRVWLDQSTVMDIHAVEPYAAELSFGKTHLSFPETQNSNSQLISDGTNIARK